MSTVKAEIKRQAPQEALYFRLTKLSVQGVRSTYPPQGGYYRLDEEPSDLASGIYTVDYFRSSLTPIKLNTTPSVTILASQNSSWKNHPNEIKPADSARQLSLPLHDPEEGEEPTESNRDETPDERETRQRMEMLKFEHGMLMKNQKLQRQQLATKEIGEMYNHQHSGRLEIHLERQTWMEERRNWMRLQMEAEKQHCERMKFQLDMMTTQFEAFEKSALHAIAKYAAPPPPPPDYTPVIMQALVTGASMFNTYMNRGKAQQPQLASVTQKIAELDPDETAKALAADPAKLTEFLTSIQDVCKPVPAVPDDIAAISARLEEIKKLLKAAPAETQPKDLKESKT